MLLAGCAVGQPVPGTVSPVPASGTLDGLRALIGNAACTNTSQCRTVAVGAKPCGGPERYMAWSTQVTDPAALAREAEAYAARRRAENERSGRASDCRFVGDPGARCVPAEGGGKAGGAGMCQLNPGSGAPAAAQ